MKVLPLAEADEPLYLDVCVACTFIWFDPNEFEKVPTTEPGLSAPQLSSPVGKAALARVELMLLRDRQEARWIDSDSPDSWWEVIPAVFGLPVEYETREIAERPVITWGLFALMVLIYIASFSNPDAAVETWGLIPGDLFRHFGTTLVTSFLLHGGLVHLLGNLYFLLVFGDNVEEDMGWRKYLLFIAASALLGDALHIMADPRSTTALIGASGGISGIIVYYALQFPKTRIGVLLYFRWYRVPIGIMLFFWLLFQVFGVLQQVSGFGNVSALAHLGGAVAGLLFWLHSRQVRSPREKEYVAAISR